MEKNICHSWLLTAVVSEHVKLSGWKPRCLSGNKTGCSQTSGVTVLWGETEAATAMDMKNSHMLRRHVGYKAGTWSRICSVCCSVVCKTLADPGAYCSQKEVTGPSLPVKQFVQL